MRKVLWRLLGYARPHVGLLMAAFACMTVLGLATGAYAYLMGPALRFLLSGGTEGFGARSRCRGWRASLARPRSGASRWWC